jgi:hypothetical protein
VIPTVSLITPGAHERYAPYVARWWESVLAMNPRPDEIVATIDADDSAGLRSIIDPNEIPTQIIVMPGPYSVDYLNTGFAAAHSEWLGFCGIDDMMKVSAYADVSEAGDADIIVGRIELSNGVVWNGTWEPDDLANRNTLPAHSLIRKKLWIELGGVPDIRWCDWGFWLKCAKRGVKTYSSKHLTAWHDLGHDHETISGMQVPDDVRAAANEELQRFRRELFGE